MPGKPFRHFFGHIVIFLCQGIVLEETCETRCRSEPGNYCRDSKGMHPEALFPQVIAGVGQFRHGIAVGYQKVGRFFNKLIIKRSDELYIFRTLIVYPECPQDQSSRVLLYREHFFSVH